MAKIIWGIIIAGIIIFQFQKYQMGGSEGALAYDFVTQELKDPSSASWNKIQVVWRGNGRSLVDLDVTAKNSFGANIRSKFCVCVDTKNKSGKVLSNDGGCNLQEAYKNECTTIKPSP